MGCKLFASITHDGSRSVYLFVHTRADLFTAFEFKVNVLVEH